MENHQLYKILSTVSTVSTISELADKVFLSQPYVSQIIKRAEEKYQITIVDRKSNPISLTTAGNKFLSSLNEIINAEEQLKRDIAPYTKENQSFIRIAFTPIWLEHFSSIILKRLKNKFPYTRFELRQVFTSLDIGKMFSLNEIDIFWGTTSIDQTNLLSKRLYTDQGCILIPKENMLFDILKDRSFLTISSLQLLKQVDFVALTNDSAFQKLVDHLFEDNGISLRKTIKVNDFITAGQLAIDGLGCTITFTDVLKYLDINSKNTKIVYFPKDMLYLNGGITIKQNNSKKVAEVANYLTKIIQEYGSK
ncbi:DNA-binding transcriptional LysR family regulator [Lactobacillus colini]|uniref:DNA-binding transcriptional LysR family regulator n=1 Tax=Lactobacillus colini TaxID=1819254 RepID=A0ABS4MF34_9LACO|nr:LysR family transcriptional regulator [Lactobacillus colini]MBP2058298.1 DNA-binding transcriptional LysR family regulator [Lactobacillus colini]